jgi:hypothetical protein
LSADCVDALLVALRAYLPTPASASVADGGAANDPKIATDGTGAAFLEGLRENGFVEGDNIIIERRFTAGRNDRAPEMVAELLQLRSS